MYIKAITALKIAKHLGFRITFPAPSQRQCQFLVGVRHVLTINYLVDLEGIRRSFNTQLCVTAYELDCKSQYISRNACYIASSA